jgi:nitrogen regulatory protein PII
MLVAEQFIQSLVRRYGKQKISTDGGTWYLKLTFGDWIKIEVLLADPKVKQIVDDLLQTISRGSASDGKIFIYDVAEAIDIGTKKTGDTVI